MKQKILISLVACFIAAGSFLHFNLVQNKNNSDISLADISVMAQADGESGGGLLWQSQQTSTPCEYTSTSTFYVFDPLTGSYITVTETLTYTGTIKNCIDGWWFCVSECVG